MMNENNQTRTETLTSQIDNERELLDLTELALALTDNTLEDYENSGKKERLINRGIEVRTILNEKRESLKAKRNALEQTRILKERNKDSFIVPPDKENYTINRVNVKEIKECIGILNDENKHSIKGWLMKIFNYGIMNRYSHFDYKTMFSTCTEGKIFQQFMELKDKPLQEIVDYLYKRYHVPKTLTSYKQSLENFVRNNGEGIEVFMTRYTLPAEKVDSMVPENERYYSTFGNKLRVLEKALCEPAKSEFIKWNEERNEECLYVTFKEILEKARIIEKTHNALPKENFSINGYEESNMDSNVSNICCSVSRISSNSHIPLRRRKERCVKCRNIDAQIAPIRSAAPRTSFYNARDEKIHNQTNSYEEANKKIKCKCKWCSEKLHVQNWYTPRTPRNRSSNQARRVRFNSVNKELKPKKATNQVPMKNSKVSRPNKQFLPKKNIMHEPVVQRWLCLRCGIGNEENKKKVGNDHRTRQCPYYARWNSHDCEICLKTKNIKAKHFAKDCLQVVDNKD